jgi:hypothetical protein
MEILNYIAAGGAQGILSPLFNPKISRATVKASALANLVSEI